MFFLTLINSNSSAEGPTASHTSRLNYEIHFLKLEDNFPQVGFFCHELFDLPLFVIRVAVAVVLGVGAVPVNAAGALLDAGTGAAPVEMLLVGAAHPPRIGRPIWEANRGKHTNVFIFTFRNNRTLWFRAKCKRKREKKSN